MRYSQTEVKAVLQGLLNGLYLFWKDAMYSEFFYNLIRLNSRSQAPLSRSRKVTLLILSILENYSKEKLDAYFKEQENASLFKMIYPWVYLVYEAANYLFKIRYFLEPKFKHVNIIQWLTKTNIHYCPADGSDKSWIADIVQNYPVFLVYIGAKLLEM